MVLVFDKNLNGFTRIGNAVAITDTQEFLLKLVTTRLHSERAAIRDLHIFDPLNLGKQPHLKRNPPTLLPIILESEFKFDHFACRVLHSKHKRRAGLHNLSRSDAEPGHTAGADLNSGIR